MKKTNAKNDLDRFPPAAPFAADTWQESARELIDHAQRALWSPAGARALAWLQGPCGLTERTIKAAGLGYSPGGGELPRGIVIPGTLGGVIYQVLIRRPTKAPDYSQLSGSRPMLYGAGNLAGADVVMITPSPLEALLAYQELGDVCGVCAFGGAVDLPDLRVWGRYLVNARVIVAAGELPRGWAVKLRLTPRHYAQVRTLQIPADSLAAYHASGGDLWTCLSAQLDPLPDWQAWGASVGANIFLAAS